MAITVTRNLLDGASAEYILSADFAMEETILVEGVTGKGRGTRGGDGSVPWKFMQAMNQPNIPRLKMRHPIHPGLKLAKITARGVASDVVNLHLLWVWTGFVSQGTKDALVASETALGTDTLEYAPVTGKVQTVTYDDLVPRPDSPNPQVQAAMVPIFKPDSVFVIRRIEANDPKDKGPEYVGYVNAANWEVKPSAAAGEWLCIGIDSDLNGGTGFFDVEYRFHHKAGVGKKAGEEDGEGVGELDSGGWMSSYQYRGMDGRVPWNITADPGGQEAGATNDFWAYTKKDFKGLDLYGPDPGGGSGENPAAYDGAWEGPGSEYYH